MRHPILHLQVLAADGTIAGDHVVFCRLQDRSVRVEQCCLCVRCDSIEDGPSPAVTCSLPNEPLTPSEDPDGERIQVGTLLEKGTVAVADTVSIRRALELLHEGDRRSVAVVDARHVMVGLVHDTCFVGGLTPAAQDGPVRASMSSPIAIDERTPVRTALKLLVANHLREATVVSKARVPIGVFRDIEGLRWIAAAHRSTDRTPR